jgi:dihydroneopterin aldolase
LDIVFISGLTASTTIGVYDHERDIRQDLIIDLELGCDTRKAGVSDSFEDALDYDAISRRTRAFVEQTSYYLIEAVAEQLSQILLDEFPIMQMKIKITKPGAVEIADAVGVIIERKRNQDDS